MATPRDSSRALVDTCDKNKAAQVLEEYQETNHVDHQTQRIMVRGTGRNVVTNRTAVQIDDQSRGFSRVHAHTVKVIQSYTKTYTEP